MTQVSEDAAFVRYPPPALSQRARGFQPLLPVKVAGGGCEGIIKKFAKTRHLRGIIKKLAIQRGDSSSGWPPPITIQVSLWPDSKHFQATKSREILPQTSQLFPNKFSIHQVLKISNKISTLMKWSNKSVIRGNSDIVPFIVEGPYFITTNICSKTCWLLSFCYYTQSNKPGNINGKILGYQALWKRKLCIDMHSSEAFWWNFSVYCVLWCIYTIFSNVKFYTFCK